MKQNAKGKAMAVLCCLALCGALLTGCAAGQTLPEETPAAGGTQIVNPLVPVGSAGDFLPLGLWLDSPEGAEDPIYTIVAGRTAQVDFVLDGAAYCLRASAELEREALSGVYEPLEQAAEDISLDCEDGGTGVELRAAQSGGRLAWWRWGEANFSLWTPDCAEADAFEALTLQLTEQTRINQFRAAYENALTFLGQSQFDAKDRIDRTAFSVRLLREEEEPSVWMALRMRAEDYFAQAAGPHWVLTIGDTSGHDFAMLVANCQSGEIIGYLPIA